MNNWKTISIFCFATAVVMSLVLLWDHSVLKVDNMTPWYFLVKGITIISFFLMSIHLFLTKKVTWHQEVYGTIFYVYSFYGLAFLDMTYSFSFIEAYFILSLGMRIPTKRFVALSMFGLLCMIAGYYLNTTEPSFVAVGESYKPHSFVVTSIFWLMSFMFYFFTVRYQNKINELNEKFALIGKQSSFLMHEIKTPLNRVLANVEDEYTIEIMNDIRRDSQKISSLVNSVEILIHRPDELRHTFSHFDWQEVRDNLKTDFDSYLKSMNIKFEIHGFEGQSYGNKYLLYQLMKNITLNAIEAIGFRKDEVSLIRLVLETADQDKRLIISNTNSTIPTRDFERIFEPHYTTKRNGTNKGLGLALVKSIVTAHAGEIFVASNNDETRFEIKIPAHEQKEVMA